MKKLLFISVCIVSILSCKKNNTPNIALNEMTDTTAVLQYSGDFTSGPYGRVSGKAEIYRKAVSYEVKLANFNSSNGPALHVYISKEYLPINFIDLGALKSITGSQVYKVTGMPDLLEFKYISIHCVDFNHLFGSALLQ